MLALLPAKKRGEIERSRLLQFSDYRLLHGRRHRYRLRTPRDVIRHQDRQRVRAYRRSVHLHLEGG